MHPRHIVLRPRDRRYFDPSHYRSVLFDQRGSGKSTPHACLEDNTTWDLVADIEKLRAHLGIDRWVVFGGSWGSTLSLAYSQKHPERCLGLILRGIFTLQRSELEWFYQAGADMLFPDFFDAYKAVIPEAERGDMMAAYYRRLTDDDEELRLKWYVTALPGFLLKCNLVSADTDGRVVRLLGAHGRLPPAS